MSDTTTAVQTVAKEKPPVSQGNPGAERRRSFRNWFGHGKEIRQAVSAVCMGDQAPEQFASFYASLDNKDKAKALGQMAKEFRKQTEDIVIDQDRAVVGANIADTVEQLARSGALKARVEGADKAVEEISNQLSTIIEDVTEENVFHNYPDLRLSCAKAASALRKDEREAHENQLSQFIRDPQLRDWALEAAFENGYRNVIEQSCHIESLVSKVIEQSDGRAIMLGAVSATDNGERKAMLKSISDAGGPAVMTLFQELVQNPKMAIDVLECAASSPAVTLKDEVTLVSKLLEKGDDEILRTALRYGGTRVIAIRSLVGSKKGRSLVMDAVKETSEERARAIRKMTETDKVGSEEKTEEGDPDGKRPAKKHAVMQLSMEESTMLKILAGLGEEKIRPILAEWSQKPETRKYLFRTAAMLKVQSLRLHNYVYGYTEERERAEGSSKLVMKREMRAARKSMIEMMSTEAERRFIPLKKALEMMFDATSKIVKEDPKKDEIVMKAFAEIEGVKAVVTAGFRYGKAAAPGPTEQRQAKIAALRASLEAKHAPKEPEDDFDPMAFMVKEFRAAVAKPVAPEAAEANTRIAALKKAFEVMHSGFSGWLRLKPRSIDIKGTRFRVKEGDIELRGGADLEFSSDSFTDGTVPNPTGQSTITHS
jgi:hypothetical protein